MILCVCSVQSLPDKKTSFKRLKLTIHDFVWHKQICAYNLFGLMLSFLWLKYVFDYAKLRMPGNRYEDILYLLFSSLTCQHFNCILLIHVNPFFCVTLQEWEDLIHTGCILNTVAKEARIFVLDASNMISRKPNFWNRILSYKRLLSLKLRISNCRLLVMVMFLIRHACCLIGPYFFSEKI